MIAYLTTPAILALLIEEPGSAFVENLWECSERVATIALAEVEVRAAIARAARRRHLAGRQVPICIGALQQLFEQVDVVPLDTELVHAAADLAAAHCLPADQGLHLAAAQRLAEEEIVVVARDSAVLEVASKLGLATAPI